MWLEETVLIPKWPLFGVGILLALLTILWATAEIRLGKERQERWQSQGEEAKELGSRDSNLGSSDVPTTK